MKKRVSPEINFHERLVSLPVRSLLEVMLEPLARSLALASVEEEQITPKTAAALDRSRASLRRGEGIPHEEILRDFGLNR